MEAVLEVRARKLEQFLFAHGVDFIASYIDPDDGMTVWVYEYTDETIRIMDEFKLAVRRRTGKGA